LLTSPLKALARLANEPSETMTLVLSKAVAAIDNTVKRLPSALKANNHDVWTGDSTHTLRPDAKEAILAQQLAEGIPLKDCIKYQFATKDRVTGTIVATRYASGNGSKNSKEWYVKQMKKRLIAHQNKA